VDHFFNIGGGVLVVVVAVFCLVLAILWILLPFAVFGIKSKMDKLILQNYKTNALLETLNERLSEPLLQATGEKPRSK
jgi:hypothetical protein